MRFEQGIRAPGGQPERARQPDVYEAQLYEGKVKGGNILIAVSVGSADMREAVEGVLERGGAHDIKTTTEASVPRRERFEEREDSDASLRR